MRRRLKGLGTNLAASRNTLGKWMEGRTAPRPWTRKGLLKMMEEDLENANPERAVEVVQADRCLAEGAANEIDQRFPNWKATPTMRGYAIAVAAHVAARHRTASEQIERLAEFIMFEIPGEPSESQGAVDTVIRWIRAALPATAPSEEMVERVARAIHAYRQAEGFSGEAAWEQEAARIRNLYLGTARAAIAAIVPEGGGGVKPFA
jgi:hypothetical protein